MARATSAACLRQEADAFVAGSATAMADVAFVLVDLVRAVADSFFVAEARAMGVERSNGVAEAVARVGGSLSRTCPRYTLDFFPT